MTSTWTVVADFDRDGVYETDLTDDIEVPGSGILLDRGFGRNGIYQTSKATFVVTNRGGKYIFGNTASPLAGKLKAGVPIKATVLDAGIGYTAWTGYIQSYKMSGFSEKTIPTCTLECSDLAAQLAQFTPVNVPLAERTTRQAYEAVALAAGLKGTDFIFDGVQTLPIHWARAVDALTAMAQIQQSEMGGQWWVDALGRLRGQSRYTRLGTNVAQTWGDGSAVYPTEAAIEISDEDVISKVSVQANVFVANADEQTIFEFSRNAANSVPDSIYLAPGETYGPVVLDYATLPTVVAALVSGTDYTASATINGGSDMTGSLEVTNTELGAAFELKLRNTSSTTGIYVTKFQKRGLSSDYVPDRPVFTYSLPIPGDKMERGMNVQLPYADDSRKPRDFSVQLVRTYRSPYPRLRLTFNSGRNAATMAAMLDAEIGDLVHYQDTSLTTRAKTYSNDWWYIDRITMRLSPQLAGRTFPVTFELVPSYLFRNLDAIAYDQFNRAAATGSLGLSTCYQTWSGDSGFDITSEFARANSDSLQTPVLDLGLGITDQVVEVLLSAIGAGDEVGVSFRYLDGSNHYRFYLSQTAGQAILERVSGGSATTLANPAYTVAVGASAEMRVIAQAGRIRCYVNDTLYIDVENPSPFAGTKCGLFARNANGTTLFNEFYGQGLNGSLGIAEARMPEITPMPLRAIGQRRIA